METVARYNKEPFITDFVRQQPKPRILPNRYEKDVLCEIIEQVLLGEYAFVMLCVQHNPVMSTPQTPWREKLASWCLLRIILAVYFRQKLL